jgi:hypothetical protein
VNLFRTGAHRKLWPVKRAMKSACQPVQKPVHRMIGNCYWELMSQSFTELSSLPLRMRLPSGLKHSLLTKPFSLESVGLLYLGDERSRIPDLYSCAG